MAHANCAGDYNRFEHSIGVAHLAYRLVCTLRRNQPHLHIDDRDVLAVTFAALCHDIGKKFGRIII